MPLVLIVDDESQIRELLARWIGAAGHEVRQAATAAGALEDMQVAAADVVMCDVMLPGESGLWLTGQLRTQFPATAVVLVTAVKTVAPHITMQPGVVAYLAKPFTREDVLDAVKLAVGWHLTAVNDPDLSKPRAALPKAWVGSSGS